MSKILSLSVVSAKLATLACFSVMGMIGNIPMLQAASPSDPCHKIEMAMEKNTESNCSACVDSELLWSQDLVFTKNTVLKDFPLAIVPMESAVLVFQTFKAVERETLPDPPDIAFHASPLRTQEGIVLLN